MKNALNKIYYVSKNHCVQGAERRGSSAWSERSTHNRKVAGSNPASGIESLLLIRVNTKVKKKLNSSEI